VTFPQVKGDLGDLGWPILTASAGPFVRICERPPGEVSGLRRSLLFAPGANPHDVDLDEPDPTHLDESRRLGAPGQLMMAQGFDWAVAEQSVAATACLDAPRERQ
jgi:hypothetical protein